jgi:hypothetical protein
LAFICHGFEAGAQSKGVRVEPVKHFAANDAIFKADQILSHFSRTILVVFARPEAIGLPVAGALGRSLE